MFKFKILTFLTLPLLLNITIRADIDYSKKIEFSGAFEKIKISKEGLIAGENNSNYSMLSYNGLYLSKDLNLNFSKIGLPGTRITDIDSQNGETFVTNYNIITGSGPGLIKFSNYYKKMEMIGKFGYFNKVHIFKDKVYYGGNNYGAWVINRDGSNNKQILGTGGYGPQIDSIISNSKYLFVLNRGNLYITTYENDSLAQIFPGYRINNIAPTEDIILASSNEKFLHMDFQGKVLYEKKFSYPIGILKRFENYVFVTESSLNDQKIWVSNNLGKTFYQSKTIFNPMNPITDIVLTGKDKMTIFINIYSKMIIKADFIFDFEDQRFLSLPFKTYNSNSIVDRITTFFDHRYPYLGNLTEPNQFSETTLNFYGLELKKPLIYYSSHDGIDFGLPRYSNILAAEKGVASYIYNPGGLGHAIIISHPNNYLTVYGHLEETDLITKTSVEVKKGQVIGKVGMSGNTNGPHLHFTVYKGSKELNNKVDPFGWLGKFEDPWVSKSSYLWETSIPNLNQEINLNKVTNISNDSIDLKLDLLADENTYHLTFYPISPIFDKNNFKYREDTSYKLEISNLLNEKVIAFASIRFKGFTNPQDEKKYSIFKYNGENLIKMESLFDREKNILSSYTNVDGQYMVLENGYKKIASKSSFKIKK